MQSVATDVTKAQDKEQLDIRGLERLLSDIDYQPRWQVESQRCADYYDGKQLDAAVLQVMQERGMAPLVFNLVAPAIDGVLGMEAKTRTDWICRADNDDGLEVAEALNEKLNEAMRIMNANRACSDAYAAQAKAGLGWVEVNRNSDPFKYEYRCNYVHRREIYWDWYAKEPDLSDARYLVRHKWVDADQAKVAFPKHKHLIDAAVNGWDHWFTNIEDVRNVAPELMSGYEDYSVKSMSDFEYFDYGRKRLKVYEVWYRVYVKGKVMKLENGRAVRFDPTNKMHRAAEAGGHVQIIEGVFPVMRLAFFLGPHRVMDIKSPLPHNSFPYIPFWGFKEDGTGIPYGLIRRMLSPQDEVNARRSKMMWLMTAKRVIMDSDATELTMEEVLDETARADGVIVMNPNRKNRDASAFRVEQDFQLAAQQFQVMKDAEEMIQNTSGVYNAMLGKGDEQQSGIAISSLVEQSSTTLAELNDNYRYSRRLVGEQMLDLIVHDMGRKEETVVVNVDRPMKTKRIQLNKREVGDDGREQITNDVVLTRTKVVLDDITATAGYRAQIANRIMDLIGTLPDDIKAQLMPIALEATDVPQRDKMIEVLNRVLGNDIDIDKMSDEERQAYEQEQQIKAKQRELEMAEMEQKVAEIAAKVKKLNAEAGSKEYDNRKKEAETEKVLEEVAQLRAELDNMRDEQVQRIDAENAALEARNTLSQLDITSAVA